MQKKSLISAIVTLICLSMFLSGCNADTTSPTSITSTSGLTPIPTNPPNNERQTQGSASPIPTNPPNNETQIPNIASPTPVAETPTPDSTPTSQTAPAKLANTTGINTGLPDGTKVKLFISGKEMQIHWAIIMGDEVLIPDYPYTFGQLKDAGGETAGFWTITFNTQGAKDYKERIIIYDLSHMYTIELVEGEYSFTCNDETFPLTVPAQTIDDMVHVPLIALAKAINATVEWDADEQAIKFFYK